MFTIHDTFNGVNKIPADRVHWKWMVPRRLVYSLITVFDILQGLCGHLIVFKILFKILYHVFHKNKQSRRLCDCPLAPYNNLGELDMVAIQSITRCYISIEQVCCWPHAEYKQAGNLHVSVGTYIAYSFCAFLCLYLKRING